MPKQASSRKTTASSAGEVFITRQVHFNSAHRLHNPRQSAAWNRKQYGPCNELHGHNYVLEVTVRGRPDPVTGYVADLGWLKDVMNRAVADKCDHRSLNGGVDFLRGIIPSTENLVIAFWRQLAPHIKSPAALHCVRLYETPRNFAEYFGGDDSAADRSPNPSRNRPGS
ncbi:6-carboxytetrahydropterin synthase [Opitutus sp. GAS368]|jgi:6-pyruvoyltetrahydropterin/6-carboxytetrahydropterin synthase|uniref:6-pyruvoyl trahydropterin synthase family protein n=1 Tax=Opitutus sp. GAS368 TaxID=1882749 RepID=UPI00087CFCE6|nr:6-carboxytetrahydropterin synthase [Opitutus sp. GAS368]SDR79965.1 6-pyruvoyltetrahydropterin/6-carboxytetrahydropterin synthase [Opitutus sp. GAS368]